MREHGYVEGQNIAVEHRFGGDRTERLVDFAAELVRLPVDVIVARGLPAIQAAKEATSTIPIVFPVSGNPVELGFVDSLARPGGNVTGLTNLHRGVSSKRLELLKEAIPRVARVAVLWHQDDGGFELSSGELPEAARTLQLHLQSVEMRGPADLEPLSRWGSRNGPARCSPREARRSSRTRDGSWAWPLRIASRACTTTGRRSRPVACWPMARTCPACTGRPRPSWTRS